DCQNSTGVISHKTIVANHPWVTDPEEEWKQIEEEKNEALDPGYDFGNAPKEPDEEDEDGEE
nr:phage portal protein [Butyrivibrio sp.]